MSMEKKIIAKAFMEMAEGLESGSFGGKPRIALTGIGSEHGEENAKQAQKADTPHDGQNNDIKE